MSGDGDGVYAWLQANGWEWASEPTERNVTDAIEVRDAEIERLRAENRTLGENGAIKHARWNGERALADQLADVLRAVQHDRPSIHTEYVWWAIGDALNAWEARREQ